MCYCNTEFVDHLLLFCPIAHSLWMYMLRLFEIDWVMPGLVVDLLFCWYNWLGKHSSDIWNLVSGFYCGPFGPNGIGSLLKMRGKLWFNYQSFANRPSLIGLVVGVSRIVLPLWIFFRLLEQIRGCFYFFVTFVLHSLP